MNNTMKILLTLVLLATSGLLSSCAMQSTARTAPADHGAQVLIERLQAALPGAYSSYAQVQDSAAGSPVIDLNIRPLNIPGEPVFLFESRTRDLRSTDDDIYWVKQNPQSGRAELHFTRLTGDELSMSLQDTLAIAWQRVQPGCVIVLSADAQHIYGQSRPESCRFENPFEGETRFYRSFSLGPTGLEMATEALRPGEQATPANRKLILQKLKIYQARVSVGKLDQTTGKYGEWQSSAPFNIRDDGAVIRLYSSDMKPMQIAVQLALLHWRDGEPPYYKFTVIDSLTGLTQAYRWFKAGSEPIVMKLKWFRAELELKLPETEAGNG